MVCNPPNSQPQGESLTPQSPIGSRCTDSCHTPTGAQAHCSVCHRTFARSGGFDRHRRGGVCLDPVTLGMRTRLPDVWSTPMSDVECARLLATFTNG